MVLLPWLRMNVYTEVAFTEPAYAMLIDVSVICIYFLKLANTYTYS